MHRWRRAGLVVVWGAVMAACSEPPVKEHDQAVTAIATARDAGAAAYAADQLSAATVALARYDQFVAERDYKQAFGAAIEARDLAYEAGQTAKTRQQALDADATRLAAVLDASIAAVDADLKAKGRIAARHQSTLRKARGTAAKALQDARAAAARGEYTAAIEQLNGATSALTTVREKVSPPARKAR